MRVSNFKRRKMIGGVALGLLVLIGFVSRYVPGYSQDEWGLWWRIAFVIAGCVALFAAFYDRKNLSEKTWDFSPKRGLLYFFLGWIIFPLMMGIDAIFASDFTLSRMVLATLALSVLIGVAGTFTENVGV